MKKILIIHNKYRSEGGEDIAVENEVKFLKNNYEVSVLTYFNTVDSYFFQLFSFLFNSNRKSNKMLIERLDKFKPDVVYIHNTWFKASLGLFKILNKYDMKVILKLHNFRYDCTRTFSKSGHLKGENLCLKCGFTKESTLFFNKYFNESYIKSFFVIIYGKQYFKILKYGDLKILVLTEFHKNYLKELGVDNTKLFVLPNFLNISMEFEKNNNERYLIYAGRISKEKGVEELIKVFLKSKIKNLSLKIVGEGPALSNLKKNYSTKNIEFYGHKTNSEVLNLISNSVAVVTATKLYEGQPTLLCEATLLGVPSIYPLSGGIGEFFSSNSTLFFKQFNYDDLLKKILCLEDTKLVSNEIKSNKEHLDRLINKKNILNKLEVIINE